MIPTSSEPPGDDSSLHADLTAHRHQHQQQQSQSAFRVGLPYWSPMVTVPMDTGIVIPWSLARASLPALPILAESYKSCCEQLSQSECSKEEGEEAVAVVKVKSTAASCSDAIERESEEATSNREQFFDHTAPSIFRSRGDDDDNDDVSVKKFKASPTSSLKAVCKKSRKREKSVKVEKRFTDYRIESILSN